MTYTYGHGLTHSWLDRLEQIGGTVGCLIACLLLAVWLVQVYALTTFRPAPSPPAVVKTHLAPPPSPAGPSHTTSSGQGSATSGPVPTSAHTTGIQNTQAASQPQVSASPASAQTAPSPSSRDPHATLSVTTPATDIVLGVQPLELIVR